MKSADKLSNLDIYINKLLRNDKNQQGFMAFLKFSEGNCDKINTGMIIFYLLQIFIIQNIHEFSRNFKSYKTCTLTLNARNYMLIFL